MIQVESNSEVELLERIISGDKALYEIVVRRYNPFLYKIGRSYNYDHEDTQDLMQETFIDAYKSLSKFENRASFKTWIFRIMLNNCHRKSQKLSFKNELSKEIKEDSKPMFSNSKNSADAMVHKREVAHVIEAALSKIPEEYRMVFSLREINELSTAETAELLNITETNVKVRLNRAKTMLRNEIEKNYTAKELYEFNLIYCNAIVSNVMQKINEL
ncbi:MAG: sigma-70 family RNA polymerase sigma factor [Chitinophagales bacterium]|nr:sigma-70 family RNA polymerase sigma factor [Chitinophagales bacterium]MCO5281234.1 sigma-70 family RNA polymerase sigma factor [Chitinophagales bacterium]OJV25540.1 MAG: RNA polymerase subunit sigma-24 [Bacteroidetes bacterium 37-13]HRN94410.1 sigma-70 family RNA polymerase sigma factor [Chitinophagales bacterium]HRP38129.1 sigma-70 family RNA polymerase sigma factor [Chitinophagales bacterium]